MPACPRVSLATAADYNGFAAMPNALLAALLSALPLAAQNTGAIEGTIVNPITGLGVAGVAVTVYTRQAVRYEVSTDASGKFQATGMAAGAYEVRVEKDLYTAGRKEPPQPYVVSPGQNPPAIRIEMTRQAAVSGRVLDPDGMPASGVQVKLGDLRPSPVDARGEFRFTDVPPGYYTLLAIPQGAKSPIKANPDEVRLAPVPTYYPSSTDPEAAKPIVVRGDPDLTDLEIKLRTDAVHRVRGIVLNETGARVPGARVSLRPVIRQRLRVLTNVDGAYLTIAGAGPGSGMEVGQVATGANGDFVFDAVPSGDWVIVAALSPSVSGTTSVGRADVDDLRISGGAQFTLTTSFEWRDMPARRETIQLMPAYSGTGVGGFVPGENSNIRLVPSRYYVVPLCFTDCYPVSALLGGQEVLGQAVDLVSSAQALHVIYKQAAGSLRGTVDNAASTILLIPDQIPGLGFGRIERAKPDGSFEVTGIVPGNYAVAALLGLPQAARLDSDVLEKVIATGARVSISESSSGSVNLTAVPWLQ
jgi:hypothetical protein